MFRESVKMDKRTAIKNIKIFVEKLERDFKIEKIIFFGSRARGKHKEESDIDLIIVSPDFKGMNFFERVSKMYEYWDLEMPVDFICYTNEEFNHLKKRISIVRDAVEEGVVVQ